MFLLRRNFLESYQCLMCSLKTTQHPFSVGGAGSRVHVFHDRNKQRFTVNLDNDGITDIAELRYSGGGNGSVHLQSTTVPEAFRGKGVAATLAKAAMDFVVEENLKASVSCWYIKKYVDENPHRGYQSYIID